MLRPIMKDLTPRFEKTSCGGHGANNLKLLPYCGSHYFCTKKRRIASFLSQKEYETNKNSATTRSPVSIFTACPNGTILTFSNCFLISWPNLRYCLLGGRRSGTRTPLLSAWEVRWVSACSLCLSLSSNLSSMSVVFIVVLFSEHHGRSCVS